MNLASPQTKDSQVYLILAKTKLRSMPFTHTQSARDVARQLDPLQSQIQAMYDKQGIELYDENLGNVKIEDVRAATLMTCKQDIMNNILILNILASKDEGKFTETEWRSMIGLEGKTIPIAWLEKQLSQYMRLSFVTMFQFRIENMVVNLLNTLNKTKVTRQYLKNAENLLSLIDVSDKAEILKILKILQNIRNSLHGNGVHNNASFSIAIEDCEFSFQTGQKITCAGWAHIIVAVKATIDVLDKILNSPQVKILPAPIIDHYIEQA